MSTFYNLIVKSGARVILAANCRTTPTNDAEALEMLADGLRSEARLLRSDKMTAVKAADA